MGSDTITLSIVLLCCFFVLTLVGLLVTLLISFYKMQSLERNFITLESYYDRNIPSKYDQLKLDSLEKSYQSDSIMKSHFEKFKNGITSYRKCDYENVIKNLVMLGPILKNIEDKQKTGKLNDWISDLYYYLGVSYLAISRTRKYNFNMNTRRIYAFYSSKCLLYSEEFKHDDRKTYFLGLSYIFMGRKDLAIEKLSPFVHSKKGFRAHGKAVLNKIKK